VRACLASRMFHEQPFCLSKFTRKRDLQNNWWVITNFFCSAGPMGTVWSWLHGFMIIREKGILGDGGSVAYRLQILSVRPISDQFVSSFCLDQCVGII